MTNEHKDNSLQDILKHLISGYLILTAHNFLMTECVMIEFYKLFNYSLILSFNH